jgi:hypothetical protein
MKLKKNKKQFDQHLRQWYFLPVMQLLTTPQEIALYRLLAIRSGLKLEIKTGLRHSSNGVFNAAKKITGMKTREKCLIALNEIIDNQPA